MDQGSESHHAVQAVGLIWRTLSLGAQLSKKNRKETQGAENDEQVLQPAQPPSTEVATRRVGQDIYDRNFNVESIVAAAGLTEHRFLCLSQYSVFRAFLHNANILALDMELFKVRMSRIFSVDCLKAPNSITWIAFSLIAVLRVLPCCHKRRC